VALCQARISTKPLWGFSSSNPYHSQSRAEHYQKPNPSRETDPLSSFLNITRQFLTSPLPVALKFCENNYFAARRRLYCYCHDGGIANIKAGSCLRILFSPTDPGLDLQEIASRRVGNC
jgi:hypothetical protein